MLYGSGLWLIWFSAAWIDYTKNTENEGLNEDTTVNPLVVEPPLPCLLPLWTEQGCKYQDEY